MQKGLRLQFAVLLNILSVLMYTRLTIHIVQFQLIQDTSRQQLGLILPGTINTVKCS